MWLHGVHASTHYLNCTTAAVVPVCAEDGLTYMNTCLAAYSGAKVVHSGQCSGKVSACDIKAVCQNMNGISMVKMLTLYGIECLMLHRFKHLRGTQLKKHSIED